MEKYFKEIDRYIFTLSNVDLHAALDAIDQKSYLLRTIIMNEKQHFTQSKFYREKPNGTRSLRSFWYKVIKPVLSRLGKINQADKTEEALTRWDAELSRQMSMLVRNGFMNYSDIGIKDTSRMRNLTELGNASNILIAVEKDTVFDTIKDLAGYFGCQAFSMGGKPAFSATEEIFKKLIGRAGIENIYIYSLTDYDPTGYQISEIIGNQIQQLINNTHRHFRKPTLTSKRIGITPDQLTAQEVEFNAYTPKATGREKWFKRTGGINGKPDGLELDALTATRIKEIFIKALEDVIQPEKYLEDITKRVAHDFIESQLEEIVLSQFEELQDRIFDAQINLTEKYKEKVKPKNEEDFFMKAMETTDPNSYNNRKYFAEIPDTVKSEIANEIRKSFHDVIPVE